MTSERWLPVVGWVGYYDVSDLGRVRSVARLIVRGNGSPYRVPARTLKHERNDDEHVRVTLYRDGTGFTRLVHRLVLEAFVGPCPDGMEGCHWDDDPKNNPLSNLRWDTLSANRHDMVRNGRHHGARKDQCPADHLLQLPNLTAASVREGARDCLACNRARGPFGRAVARGETVTFREVADAKYALIMAGVR